MVDPASSTLLLGNAPSAGTYRLGTLIDRFAVVIRMNRFPTTGFTEQVGSRCSVWACSPYFLAHEDPPFDDFMAVFVTSHSCTGAHRTWANSKKEYYGKRCRVIDTDITDVLAKDMDFHYRCSVWPSTGSLAFSYFLPRTPGTLVLHGFDFLQSALEPTAHYYPALGRAHLGCHDPERERRYFDKMMATGRAVTLESVAKESGWPLK